MFIIYSTEKRRHLLPFTKTVYLLLSKSSWLYLSFPYQDGGEKAQVLVTASWLAKKIGAVMAVFADTMLWLQTVSWCYHFVSAINQSPNGQGWHCDISKTLRDKIWVEINFVSQILGYYSEPFLASSSAYMGFSWSSKYYWNFVSWLL